jgi:hypothetical protein
MEELRYGSRSYQSAAGISRHDGLELSQPFASEISPELWSKQSPAPLGQQQEDGHMRIYFIE